MQPVVIIPPGCMSEPDIKRLRDNGICVVRAKDPKQVRYMEPYPAGYSVQDEAAIRLTRMLLEKGSTNGYRTTIAAMYADILLEGWPIKPIESALKLPEGR